MSPRVEPLRRRLDDRSFERLYRQHLPEIYRYVLRDVGNRADAEEVTQNAFLDAYRALGRGHAPEKPRAWLFGIAKNVARESLRARARNNRHVDLDDKSVLDLSDQGPVPVSQLLSKELNELIQTSLASLDEDKRLVFTLKVFQQCSYEEIADITGFSIPKLKTDLHRARSEMRRRISPYVRL